MKKNDKLIASVGALIWLIYIVVMWIKNGIKSSISALYGYIQGSFLRRRIIIGLVYVLSAAFLAYSVYLMNLSLVITIISMIGAAGLAICGVVPSHKDRFGNFRKIQDILHNGGAITGIVFSSLFVILGSIVLANYWLLIIPALGITVMLYMLKKSIKNHTTWIELTALFQWMLFILIY